MATDTAFSLCLYLLFLSLKRKEWLCCPKLALNSWFKSSSLSLLRALGHPMKTLEEYWRGFTLLNVWTLLLCGSNPFSMRSSGHLEQGLKGPRTMMKAEHIYSANLVAASVHQTSYITDSEHQRRFSVLGMSRMSRKDEHRTSGLNKSCHDMCF